VAAPRAGEVATHEWRAGTVELDWQAREAGDELLVSEVVLDTHHEATDDRAVVGDLTGDRSEHVRSANIRKNAAGRREDAKAHDVPVVGVDDLVGLSSDDRLIAIGDPTRQTVELVTCLRSSVTSGDASSPS